MNSNQRLNKLIRKGIQGKHAETVNSHRDYLPNFIIIGAAKSATTTLTTILPQHPDVFISKPKEPKFFGRYEKDDWWPPDSRGELPTVRQHHVLEPTQIIPTHTRINASLYTRCKADLYRSPST